jgi:Tfp pilus assembly protein FimV
MTKYLLLPALFAVTATSVSAFNSDLLEQIDVDLTNGQVSALEEAHELRQAGADRDEIRAVLEEADLDRETLRDIREAMREHRQERRESIREAVADNDYDAFQDAAEGTRLGDAVDSEADFDLLREAHELREDGDREGAREILDELGLERPDRSDKREGGQRGFGPRS